MRLAACLALILAALLAYAPVFSNGFVNYDDDFYVTANRHVRAGLSPGAIAWAFTTSEQANWHPLTWVSHTRKRPWVTVGWFWTLCTLVPVIGIVQVGEQALADRYTYIPLVGVSIAVAWALPVKIGRGLGAAALLVLALLTYRQAGVWRDSRTLFEHALQETGRNHVAQINLGLDREAHEDAPAIERYRQALSIKVDSVVAHHNLGRLLSREPERRDEGIRHLRQAVAMAPGNAKIHVSLGIALAAQGNLDEAAEHFDVAVKADPESAEARYDWGTALMVAKRWDEAVAELSEAVRLEPTHAKAHHNLAVARYYRGEYAEAWREVAAARELGFPPSAEFLAALSERMPAPGVVRQK